VRCDPSVSTRPEERSTDWEIEMPIRLLATTALSMLLLSQAAHGQAANDDERTQAAAEERAGLAVITVTAQRREESLQDAAIPLNAASGEDLARAGVVDATQLNKVAPALYVPEAGGANVGYFIRGVGNFANNGYTNPAVAFNLDGVYIGQIGR